MSYIVFARKWRPQNFEDIIGQDHIVTTLKNAIQNKRVAHAYLFSGPRGTGKTSTARIFAKALNCKNGPTVLPCNKCTPCLEITSGISMDVIEIDGASNRSIDDIRNLRENIKFTPVNGNFKIYIIDEVHQITQDGFNALLKTLEEPPSHVKFIFATTHPHKVIPTILSRCQRFDFKRLPTNEIVSKLKLISKKENILIKDEALFAIARNCEGSMRDAESVLDQLASIGEGAIEVNDVNKILGIVNDDVLFEIVDYIAKRESKNTLLKIDQLIANGVDQFNLVSRLMEHVRNLMIAKLSLDSSTLELTKESIEGLKKQSGGFSSEELLYVFYLLSNTLNEMKRFTIPSILLEMCMVKLCSRSDIGSINSLIEKIETLSKDFKDGNTLEAPNSNKINKDIILIKEEKKEENKNSPESAVIPEKKGPDTNITIEEVRNIWHEAIKNIKEKKISVGIYLSEGAPHEISGNIIRIGFEKNLHKESLERQENKRLIEDIFKSLLKLDLRVEFVIVPNLEKIPLNEYEIPESSGDSENIQRKTPSKNSAMPIINSALEIFGGEIVGEDES